MLSLDPTSIMGEIRDAEERRDKTLQPIVQLLRRILGRYYQKDAAILEPTPENYAWSFLTYVLPQMGLDNPTSVFEPVGGEAIRTMSEAMQSGVNQWMKDVDAKTLLRELSFEVLTGFGATMVNIEPRGDYDPSQMPVPGTNDSVDPGDLTVQPNPEEQGQTLAPSGDFDMIPLRPTLTRIHRSSFFVDAYAKDRRHARIIGRKFQRDIDDLKRDQRYDQEQVGDPSAQVEQPKDSREPYPPKQAPTERRKVVTLFEVYLPEYRKLLTMLSDPDGRNGKIIRQEDYFGHPDGPFQLWGAFWVPGELYPLAPLIAIYEQFCELQDHAVKISEDAAKSKKVAVVTSTDPTLAKKLGDAKPGDVLTANDANAVLSVEVGGSTPSDLNFIQWLRERFDKLLGQGDAQRGVANDQTVGVNQLAQSAGDMRINGYRQAVKDELVNVLRRVSWYFMESKNIAFPVVQTDAITGQQTPGTFVGGRWPGQEDFDIEHMGISIDTHDEAHDDPLMQKRAQDLLAISTQLAPIMVQFPMYQWSYLWDIVGDSMKIPHLSKRFLPQGPPPGMMQPPSPPPGAGPSFPAPGTPGQAAPPGVPNPVQAAQAQVGGIRPPMPGQMVQNRVA